jgi:hypothetical protein
VRRRGGALVPENGEPLNAENPDGGLYQLPFDQGRGLITYLLLADQDRVDVLLVTWVDVGVGGRPGQLTCRARSQRRLTVSRGCPLPNILRHGTSADLQCLNLVGNDQPERCHLS